MSDQLYKLKDLEWEVTFLEHATEYRSLVGGYLVVDNSPNPDRYRQAINPTCNGNRLSNQGTSGTVPWAVDECNNHWRKICVEHFEEVDAEDLG